MIDIPKKMGCTKTPFPFTCRQAVHFTAGAIIGGASRLFMLLGFEAGVIARVSIGCVLFGYIVVKEIFEDNHTQHRYKTFVDVLSWTAGYVLVAVWG